MTHQKSSTGVAYAVLAVCVAIQGCTRAPVNSAKKIAQNDTTVAVAKVTRQDLARDLELAAEFRAYQEIELHAKISGYLRAIHVDVGDRVQKGQLLAALEVPEMIQELAQAAALAKRSTMDVERAKRDVLRAEAAVKIRKISYDRLAGVFKARPNLIAQQEIDDAAAHLSDADAQLGAAQAMLAATEEQVHVALANKERADTMLSYLKITAPFAGIITERRGDPGALVQAGTASHIQAMPVVRLSQVDRLRLVLPVPESMVPRIKIGSPVEVRVDSLNRVFQGRVARFTGRLSTSTRTMDTEVDIPNPNYAIMPGMYGYASLKLDQRQNTLAVPVQAVAGQGAKATVMVVNERGELREQPIATGIRTPDLIEVLGGVKESEMVVIGGRTRLKAGMTVLPKPIERSASVRSH